MIRRDAVLADGSAGWLLISQLEHARIAGELAAACLGAGAAGEFGSRWSEVHAAIVHHDDGWLEWERTPRCDPHTGCPVSYTHLEPAEAPWLCAPCRASPSPRP